MIGRRRFLELATIGLASASLGADSLFAQDPAPPKTKGRRRGKGIRVAPKSTPAVETSPPVGFDANEQISRIVGQARTDGRRLPGMIGAVVQGEELAGIGVVGIRKIGSPELMRADDLVHLGSCTKAMTATMLGTLVDEGKLRWDSTVVEVFPEWAESINSDYASVTLAQLLAHRGGFPHDVSWWGGGRGFPVMDQRRALLSKALQATPKDKPGSTYSYSNVGYVLAGAMAEQVTRTPWEDLMRRRLFGPLGMSTAGFGAPGTRGLVDHAWGHRASGDIVEAVHQDNPPAMGPAGTVHCSMRDWGRFASFHIRGSLGGTRILKPETLEALHTPKAGEDYAGGWSVLDRSWAGGKALMHSGSNTFWYCTTWLAPAKDFALLVATNAAGKPAEEACDQAIKGILRFTTGEERHRQR